VKSKNTNVLNAGTKRRTADFPEKETILNWRYIKEEKGAAAVEFAFALLALFFFFAIYMQFIQIFLVHERLVFTGFTASRTHAVRGEIPARRAAEAIDADARLVFAATTIHLRRDIPIPDKLSDIFSAGGGKFKITHQSPFFDELDLKNKVRGDN
jgi:hypothetical protein